MSMLGRNAVPAERMRNASFVETARSFDDCVKNGAAIGGGTPVVGASGIVLDGASWFTYAIGNQTVRQGGAMSLLVELTPTTAGAQGAVTVAAAGVNIKIAGGNWVVGVLGIADVDTGIAVVAGQRTWVGFTLAAAGGTLRTYVAGVAGATRGATTPTLGGDTNIWIGTAAGAPFTGTIHSVRWFGAELAPEEMLQYANGSLWAYKSKPSIYLPMRNVDHQALQTLDVSGNQRHGVFSATAPTKLSGRHGYTFAAASSNYTTTALGGAFNTSEITFATEFEPLYTVTGATHYFWDSTGAARYLMVKAAATSEFVIFMNGSVVDVPAGLCDPYWCVSGRNTFVVSGKTGKNNVWLNGVRVLADNATAWSAGDPATLWIGSTNGPGTYQDARVTRFASYPQALTGLQVMDLLSRWQATASET
jgi:hypothetical protein